MSKSYPKRVVIFGATSGIAMAVARELAEAGASLFLVARSEEKLAAVAGDLKAHGAARADYFVTDLDQTEVHPQIIDAAVQSLGSIEMALIAHGVLGDQPAAEKDFAVAKAILHTNFISAASLITLLANYFEGTKQGVLAVISSVAGDRGRKSNYIYGTSKAALTVMLEGVRNRIDRAGVRVLTIKPGFVATAMTAHLPRGPLFASPKQVAKGILKAVAQRKDVVYLPGFWRPIMLLIRHLPESIFKKLNL